MPHKPYKPSNTRVLAQMPRNYVTVRWDIESLIEGRDSVAPPEAPIVARRGRRFAAIVNEPAATGGWSVHLGDLDGDGERVVLYARQAEAIDCAWWHLSGAYRAVWLAREALSATVAPQAFESLAEAQEWCYREPGLAPVGDLTAPAHAARVFASMGEGGAPERVVVLYEVPEGEAADHLGQVGWALP